MKNKKAQELLEKLTGEEKFILLGWLKALEQKRRPSSAATA